jgi:hypothetical protein
LKKWGQFRAKILCFSCGRNEVHISPSCNGIELVIFPARILGYWSTPPCLERSDSTGNLVISSLPCGRILPVFEDQFHWFLGTLRVIRVYGCLKVYKNEANGKYQPEIVSLIPPNWGDRAMSKASLILSPWVHYCQI